MAEVRALSLQQLFRLLNSGRGELNERLWGVAWRWYVVPAVLLIVLFCAGSSPVFAAVYQCNPDVGTCSEFTAELLDGYTACNEVGESCVALFTVLDAGLSASGNAPFRLCAPGGGCTPISPASSSLLFCRAGDGVTGCKSFFATGAAGYAALSASANGADFSSLVPDWTTVAAAILGAAGAALFVICALVGVRRIYQVMRGEGELVWEHWGGQSAVAEMVGSEGVPSVSESVSREVIWDDATGRGPSVVVDGKVFPNGLSYGNTPERQAAIWEGIWADMSAEEKDDYLRNRGFGQ